MCGIFGVLSASSRACDKKRQFLEQAMLTGTLRGGDGSGIFTVPRELVNPAYKDVIPRAHWAKMATSGAEFSKHDTFRKALGVMPMLSAVIGHNRSATLGSKTTANTHPFSEGPITLVHNGTLYNHEDLTNADVDVDSHAIAHALAVEDAASVLGKLEGAFALCWYDERDGYLNIVRNAQRPLHFGITVDEDAMYIASEAGMIQWLAGRLNVSIKRYVQPVPGTLLRWHHSMKTVIPEVSKVQVSNFVTRTVTSYADYNDYAGWAAWSAAQRSGQANLPATVTNSGTSNVVNLTNNKPPKPASPVDIQPPKDVPAPMEEMLADEGLSSDDIMLFTPRKVLKASRRGRQLSVVLGTVGCAEVPACVYNVSYRLLGNTRYSSGETIGGPDRFWAVSPIGVRIMGKGTFNNERVMVIGRVLEVVSDPNSFTPEYEMEQEAYFLYEGIDYVEPVGTDEEDEDAVSAAVCELVNNANSFPGPGGTHVSRAKWLSLTNDGCYECGEPIYPADAEKMAWVDYRGIREPVCGKCKGGNVNEKAVVSIQ